MFDIKRIVAATSDALRGSWERLSVTQQITVRGIGLFSVLAMLSALIGGWAPSAPASPNSRTYNGTAVMSEHLRLRASLDSSSGEYQLLRLHVERAEALRTYSARYRVPADLAELVYDAALREGISPELGFRLVHLESRFNTRAHSRANAYGLAQVQLATARFYDPDITVERLLEPERNLTIGFRYLRDLLETYDNSHLALLAYNRGPSRVKSLIDDGRDPANGYARALMEGYSGGS